MSLDHSLPIYHEQFNSSQDNLLNDADSVTSSSALRVNNLVRHILHQHINTGDSQMWQHARIVAPNATSCVTELTPGLVDEGPETTTAPSKLKKMWNRVKKVFTRSRRRQQTIMVEVNQMQRADGPSASASLAAKIDPHLPSGKSSKLQYIYCTRYTNPGYILSKCTTLYAMPGPTFNTIMNSDIQEVDTNEKVEAWVSHLPNNQSVDGDAVIYPTPGISV